MSWRLYPAVGADHQLTDGSEVQAAPEVELAELGVVAGLVSVALRGDPGERRTKATLLDLEALGITRQLEAAA